MERADGRFVRPVSGALRRRSLHMGTGLLGPDIFISYSREDRAAARHFAECFAHEGFSVWWDAALQPGETFDEVIEKELKAAKAVVVLWSPRSVISRWVRAEATIADRRHTLAPAIIETCDRPIIFEMTHAADLADWTGDTSDPRWQDFVKNLNWLVKKGKEKEALGDSTPARTAGKANPYSVSPRAQRPAASAEAPSKEASAPGADRLMFAASNLRRAFGDSRSYEPVEPVDTDDGDHTQFYTSPHGFEKESDLLHCLEMTNGKTLEKRYVVSPLGLKIGRTAPADIILADPRVSRVHCMVELADDQLRVSDLSSTNGTYIDSERIDRAAILEVGSVLQVGKVSFKHEIRTRAEV